MSLENLVDNIQQDMLQSQIHQDVANTLPYAVLRVLGVIHNKTSVWGEDPDTFCTTLLNNEEFEFVSETLVSILWLLGYEIVVTEDENGKIASLVSIGVEEGVEE